MLTIIVSILTYEVAVEIFCLLEVPVAFYHLIALRISDNVFSRALIAYAFVYGASHITFKEVGLRDSRLANLLLHSLRIRANF